MLKPLAEKAGRLAPFCTQLPRSSRKLPPTLTAPVALTAPPDRVRSLATASALFRLMPPPLFKASVLRLARPVRSSPPLTSSVPANSVLPMAIFGAPMVASSAVVRPRLVPLSAALPPTSMLPVLLRRARLTVPLAAVEIDCAAPPRVMLSATRLTVPPAYRPPPASTLKAPPAVARRVPPSWRSATIFDTVSLPPVSRFRLRTPEVTPRLVRSTGALTARSPAVALPTVTVLAEILFSSSFVSPRPLPGLLPTVTWRPAVSGLTITSA